LESRTAPRRAIWLGYVKSAIGALAANDQAINAVHLIKATAHGRGAAMVSPSSSVLELQSVNSHGGQQKRALGMHATGFTAAQRISAAAIGQEMQGGLS